MEKYFGGKGPEEEIRTPTKTGKNYGECCQRCQDVRAEASLSSKAQHFGSSGPRSRSGLPRISVNTTWPHRSAKWVEETRGGIPERRGAILRPLASDRVDHSRRGAPNVSRSLTSNAGTNNHGAYLSACDMSRLRPSVSRADGPAQETALFRRSPLGSFSVYPAVYTSELVAYPDDITARQLINFTQTQTSDHTNRLLAGDQGAPVKCIALCLEAL